MNSYNIPKTDQIVRLLGATSIDNNGKANSRGFLLRWKKPSPPEEGLSVNWLEYYVNEGLNVKEDQLQRIRQVCRMKRGPNAMYAEMKVEDVVAALKPRFNKSSVEYHPLPSTAEHEADPSHSEIRGITPNSDLDLAWIGEKLAKCVIDLHPARSDDE